MTKILTRRRWGGKMFSGERLLVATAGELPPDPFDLPFDVPEGFALADVHPLGGRLVEILLVEVRP